MSDVEPSAKCLLIAKSICQNTGPRTLLRGALPNGCEMSVGITTASRLNQFVMVCCPFAGYGSPARFGRKMFWPLKSCVMPDTSAAAGGV